ncbi:Mix17p [Sugiyamaella lignohabitans]|uniref:Mix17p n=1 Tax=Sugiyamaella lignohabitans TaxID=796027 RepID=A0A167DRK5_9ASCO|nr:Mix17p [Sugiyamaella lignohabitans]ANB13206.1 Mix17p [Sugiyamaella lignohabitans]
MPRSSSRRSGPAPSRSAPSRSAHTMSAPVSRQAPPPPPPAAAAHHPPAQTGQAPGLFAQMASTAAGVAVGSAVGHTLANGVSSIFGGGSSVAAVPEQAAPLQAQSQYQQENAARPCDIDARNFTKCLDDNGGNMQICDWYLQQLKACQEAARNY